MTKFYLENIYLWVKTLVPSEITVIYHSGDWNVILLEFSLFVLFVMSFVTTIILKRKYSKSWFVLGFVSVFFLLPVLYFSPKVYAVICSAQGFVLENKGDREKSIAHYQAAIRGYSTYDFAYKKLINLLISGEDYDKAVDVLKKHPNWQKSPWYLVKMGDLESKRKNFAAASNYFSQAYALRPEKETKYKLAFTLLNDEKFEESIRVIREAADKECDDRVDCLFAKNLIKLKNYKQGLEVVNEALKNNPRIATLLFLKGELLAKTGQYREAVKYYESGLELKSSNPEALYELGLLRLETNEIQLARSSSYKAFYYDNGNVPAYLLYNSLKNGKRNNLEFQKDAGLQVKVLPTSLEMRKREIKRIEVEVLSEIDQTLELRALLPYGQGVDIQPREVRTISVKARKLYKEYFQIEGKRSDEVNLKKPWIINFVVSNGAKWNNTILRIKVADQEEGRIFFVLTQDQETGEKRNDHWDKTPDIGDLDLHEVDTDLILKRELGEKIAEKYGMKWTHMVDIGSSLLLLKWAAQNSGHWNELWKKFRTSLINSYKAGNDIQLHIHMGSIPQSKIFEYWFDSQSQQIILDKSVKQKILPGHICKSWANVLPKLGDKEDLNTRVGSLWRGKYELEHILGEEFLSYCVIFFRAGEWDFGKNSVERQKSILALRNVGIRADSSATTGGSYYDKTFSFGLRSGANAYFSSFNDVIENASTLLDLGLFEVVPIIMPQGHHPVTPTDNPKIVTNGYERLLEKGKIRPGVYIIMEIEHLSGIHSKSPNWDNLNPKFGKWRLMDRHFNYIKNKCPKLKYGTATQAIYEWLDYYTPGPILVLENGRIISAGQSRNTIEFDVRVLGRDCLAEKEALFPVNLVMPSYILGIPQRVKLLKNGQEIRSISVSGSDECSPHFDLPLSKFSKYNCQIEAKNIF